MLTLLTLGTNTLQTGSIACERTVGVLNEALSAAVTGEFASCSNNASTATTTATTTGTTSQTTTPLQGRVRCIPHGEDGFLATESEETCDVSWHLRSNFSCRAVLTSVPLEKGDTPIDHNCRSPSGCDPEERIP